MDKTVIMSKTDWQRVLEFYVNMLYEDDWDSKGKAKSAVDRRIIAKLEEALR